MRAIIKITALICICFCFLAFQKQKQIHFTFNGIAQGTTYLISYYHEDERVTKDQVDSILLLIDNSMSLYKPHSLISKINESPTGGELDPHFLKVMRRSFEINAETQGIFDVTVAPLVAAWGFSSENIVHLPDSAEISRLLPFIGMDKIQLDAYRLIKLNPGVKIDLNGIAQGYTVDVLAEFFMAKGVKNFLVELGGEIRVEGVKPTGEDFYLGIEGPMDMDEDEVAIKHVAMIKGRGLTTSGSYRNFIQRGNERMTHIIDSKSGYPTKSEILSVTVVAKDAMTADGYDQALLAMGIEDGFLFADKHPDLNAYFVYKDKEGQVLDTMTNGFKNILKN